LDIKRKYTGSSKSAPKKNRNRFKKKRFSPWREDFIVAFFFGGMALFCVWRAGASIIVGNGSAAGMGLLFAAGSALACVWAWKNGMRRWYGKHLEQWATDRLSVHLKRKRMTWQAGRMVGGLGDADVLVETSSGPVLIEIKAWQRWKNGDRERAGCQQALALVHSLNACAGFIWLPRGRPTFMQRMYAPRYEGIKVVFGNERKMMKQIGKWHKPPSTTQRIASVQFKKRHS